MVRKILLPITVTEGTLLLKLLRRTLDGQPTPLDATEHYELLWIAERLVRLRHEEMLAYQKREKREAVDV